MSVENTEETNELDNQHSEETPLFTVSESVERPAERFNYELVDPNEEEEEEEIDNNSSSENNPSLEKPEEEEEFELEEIDEDKAWQYLREKKGITAETIDELLSPKEQKKYAPELEKFQEFIDKTGNKSFKDFEETQRDWKSENEDTVLKEYLRLQHPDLNQKQLDRLYDKNYSIEGLDAEVDEEEITDKEIERSVGLKKAHEFLEKRKEEFMVTRGSDDLIPDEYKTAKEFHDKLTAQQKLDDEAYTSTRNDYVSKTEKLFSNDFEGFKVKLGDEKNGFEEVFFKPENIQETKTKQLDVANFNKKYFDETGVLKDEVGFHKALYFAENYETELNKAFARGMAKQLEIDDKLSKNIQDETLRGVHQNQGPQIKVSHSKT